MPTVTPLSELFNFIDIAEQKNHFNEHTIQSRRTACNKFFEELDEDQQNIEYVSEHMDVIKARFTNRHPEVRGGTVDVYAKRAALTLKDFLAWKSDRAGWERELAAKQAGRTTTAEGAEKRPRPDKPKAAPAPAAANENDSDTHTVTIPLPAGTKVVVKLPNALLVKDLQRVMWALLAYTSDWDPSVSPRQTFAQLEDRSSLSP